MKNQTDRCMRFRSERVRRGRSVPLTSCILLCLALPAWNSGRMSLAQESTSSGATKVAPVLQIQSSVLRIEFDRNLHSRVVTLFGGSPKIIAPFSVSETVAGVRTWSDFAVSTSHEEHVSDVFGSGERLSLTGKSGSLPSGSLRKDVSITIYSDFPSIAIFDVAYTNEGSAPLVI